MQSFWKLLPIAISAALALGAQSANAEIQTVAHVDVSRYLGTWYQIADIPQSFEGNCLCARQVLGVASDGNVSVYNSCNRNTVDGQLAEIRGEAIDSDTSSNSKFVVDFHLPWKGEYWIIALDTDYRYAAVTDSKGGSLYILSKTPTLDPALYQTAVAEAAKQVNTSKLHITQQDGCHYPN